MSHGHSHGGQACHGHGEPLPPFPLSPGVIGLLGETLISKKSDGTLSTIQTSDVMQGIDYVILYFSASWCPPCRQFSPILDDFITSNSTRLKTTCVFISGDKTEEEFTKYFSSHKWPFAIVNDGTRKIQLNEFFEVRGIPTVVVIDKDGEVISTDARGDVMTDPTGERFPWAPRTLSDIFSEIDNGNMVINNTGTTIEKGYLASLEYLAVYFADFGSPPCRKMTPHLIEWFNANKEGKKFDILFVSNDSEEPSFKLASETAPWMSLKFTSEQANVALAKIFEVEGIPTLGLIKINNGVPEIAKKSILRKVMVRPNDFPWAVLPACSLEEAAEENYLNESPCLILFTDKLTDAIFESQVHEAFSEVASENFDLVTGSPKNDLRFVVASEGDAAIDSIRKFLGMLSDKDGATAIRLVILNIPEQAKVEMQLSGLSVPTAEEIRTFVNKFNTDDQSLEWKHVRMT
jgi:nucleoredoxin